MCLAVVLILFSQGAFTVAVNLRAATADCGPSTTVSCVVCFRHCEHWITLGMKIFCCCCLTNFSHCRQDVLFVIIISAFLTVRRGFSFYSCLCSCSLVRIGEVRLETTNSLTYISQETTNSLKYSEGDISQETTNSLTYTEGDSPQGTTSSLKYNEGDIPQRNNKLTNIQWRRQTSRNNNLTIIHREGDVPHEATNSLANTEKDVFRGVLLVYCFRGVCWWQETMYTRKYSSMIVPHV